MPFREAASRLPEIGLRSQVVLSDALPIAAPTVATDKARLALQLITWPAAANVCDQTPAVAEYFAVSHGWTAIIALAKYASIAWQGMLRMSATSSRE